MMKAATLLPCPPLTLHDRIMIITHTQNAQGQHRVYLGGKGSLECWIEPEADKRAWIFRLEEAVTGNRLSDDDKRIWAIHTLLELANELHVPPDDLKSVPFEMIAALHNSDPYAGRRVAAPRRQALEQAYMATTPNVRRPRFDYTENYHSSRRFNQR
ncbi:MAG: hypothetical protein ABL893_04685 [Hyphomicrobium sp.]